MWSLVDDKLLNIVLRLKLNVERKVKVKANAENWFVRKFLLHRTFSFSLRCYLYHLPDMWRKICHVEKFQISLRDVEKSDISPHGEYFQISPYERCG